MTLNGLLGWGCLVVAGIYLTWAVAIVAIFYGLYKLLQWGGVW